MPLSVALIGFWLVLINTASPLAHAASPVIYTITPAAKSVQPDSNVDITITVRTDVEIAGLSIHLAFSNGSWAGFQSSDSTAFQFVYYHNENNINDLVALCTNNRCAPGVYTIGNVTAKAGASGTMKVSFVPKETLDPQLRPVAADGTTGTYDISVTAPATSKKSTPNRFTIPSGNGRTGTLPLQITNDQYTQQLDEATQGYTNTNGQSDDNKTSLTPTNLILIGLAVGAGFALFLFILFRLFGNKDDRDKSGPYGPTSFGPTGGSSTGSGPQAFVG